ncbi:single-stranded DNA-binding protein [Kouleothrix aurantiaca]|uniref:Single-stranded DNA-binding protein n=1 Tax=Kouleothrix aurantiaca TaxID=186479 RepID=A0A0P9D3J0_9CHLR|nr:single-stranded DNA-binding protein [Kouleothrix aurantiaca]
MEQIKGTLNRIELIGWLGAEPEQRFTPAGVAVCSFSVATRRWIGRGENGERQVSTDWTPVEAWERLAERCGQSLCKGSRVRVIGSLHTRSWNDRETGQKRFKTVVRAEEVMFLNARMPEAPSTETEDVASTEDIPF